MEKQNTGRFQMKQHYEKIIDIDLFDNGKIRDFLRERVFQFNLLSAIASDG